MFKTVVWLWLPVIFWCSLIFWWSSIPSLGIGGGLLDFILRKTAHMTEFGILWMLLHRAITGGRRRWDFKTVGVACGLSLLYALSDELHQQFVPTRNGASVDVLIDSVGIVIGIGVGGWWYWWNRVLDSVKLQVSQDPSLAARRAKIQGRE